MLVTDLHDIEVLTWCQGALPLLFCWLLRKEHKRGSNEHLQRIDQAPQAEPARG